MEPSMSKIMEENERLRELLQRTYTRICHLRDAQNLDTIKGLATATALQEVVDGIDDALSQQAEPECVACEDTPAPHNNPCAVCGKQTELAQAQDERQAFEAWFLSKWPANQLYRRDALPASDPHYEEYCNPHVHHAYEGWLGRAARPAQTEQRPAAYTSQAELDYLAASHLNAGAMWATPYPKENGTIPLYAAPVAQTDGVNWKAVADEQKTIIEQLQARAVAQTDKGARSE
jgi:hypothetical protein